MIEVKHLIKRYGTHTAVNDVSFSIDKGRIYGFLGPNGAGKTTTMNIITGYLAATDGQVTVNGYDILKEPEKAKKSVGYLPEMPPVYLDATTREYLRFVAELKKIPADKQESQCSAVIDKLGLNAAADKLIANLSKGYRQRVGLAQAILGFPETIILDEPMVGLDPQQIIEMRELIRSLAKNHTVILSSHILAEVREICDYIMIISSGRLVAQDTPENLEKLMGDDFTIHLEAPGSLDRIQHIISKVDNIDTVRYVRQNNGLYGIEVQPAHEHEIREDLFNAFAHYEVPLYTLYRESPTLEEIYLKLIQEGVDPVESHL